MSSWVFETYEQENQVVSYEWSKGEGYVTFAGEKYNSICITRFRRSYATKEQAKRSYQRLVRKIKKDEQIKGHIETNPLPF